MGKANPRQDRPWLPALLAIALLVATAVLRVPLEIYAAGSREFSVAPMGVFLPLLATAAALAGMAWLLLRVLPAKLQRLLAPALVALAVYGWCRAGFFPGPAIELGGGLLPTSGGTGQVGRWLPVAVGLAMAGLAAWQQRVFLVVIGCLLLGALAQSALNAALVWRTRTITPVESIAATLEFSRKGNTLVLLLDTLQSDLAAEVLANRPDLRDRLEGFTHYRLASSEAPTTFLSLPMIHGGRYYDPASSVPVFVDVATRQESFLNRLATRGYAASYAYHVLPCPGRVANCLHHFRLSPGEVDHAPMVAVQLVDIGLYRVLPDGLRKAVLGRGLNVLTVFLGRNLLDYQIIDGDLALARVASSMAVSDGPPTVKFIHSFASHPPYVLRRDCSPGERRLGRPAAIEQTECALGRVAGIVERLEREGIQDVTSIVVIADHGTGELDSRYALPGSPQGFRRKLGSHNPLMLVRPAGSRGPFVVSDLPLKLTDIAGALCGPERCSPAEGLRALSLVDPERRRLVFDYAWHHSYWQAQRLPGLKIYALDGDIRRESNWRLLAEDAVALPAGEH